MAETEQLFLGPVLAEQLCDFGVASGRGQVQGSTTLLVLGIYVSTLGDQEFHQRLVSCVTDRVKPSQS